MRLTEAELVTFREEGFVAKYGVLDPALMAQARDLLWASAPPSLRRDEPASWIGPIAKDDEGIVLMRDDVRLRTRTLVSPLALGGRLLLFLY